MLLGCQTDWDDRVNPYLLEGTWLLSEVLFDPGDGSGEFRPSDAGYTLLLKSENRFDANYDVCRGIEEGELLSGEYSRIGESELLIPCDGSLVNSVQGRLENGFLLLYYPCDEPCVYRFRKIAELRE